MGRHFAMRLGEHERNGGGGRAEVGMKWRARPCSHSASSPLPYPPKKAYNINNGFQMIVIPTTKMIVIPRASKETDGIPAYIQRRMVLLMVMCLMMGMGFPLQSKEKTMMGQCVKKKRFYFYRTHCYSLERGNCKA